MKTTEPMAAQRVALYIRVSTEEQVMRGYSLEAQREALESYAKAHGMIIVDFYQDEGKSARKSYRTRPECMRLLRDVEAGRIDLILFIKLDRWFRSVGDYYEVQRILDAHGVHWQAILEDYETVTSSGQFKVNIMLSVAQNEADRTAERMAVVFDSKIRHGTALGGSVPFGYRLNSEKRLEVMPDAAAIVLDVFEHFRSNVSQRATLRYVRDTYGLNWCGDTLKRMLRNTLYIGHYERRGRVNPNFCQPIIPRELFDTVQRLLSVNVKAAPSGRVYLFTSIMVCDECGHKLTVAISKGYVYYRCPHYSNRALCTHNRSLPEKQIESWLFDYLANELDRYRAEWEMREAERKKAAASVDRAAIKRKLARLKELYVNEVIDLDDYRRDYEQYTAQLSERSAPAPAPRPNFEAVQSVLSDDFRALYDTLSDSEKRSVWHSIIKEIRVNNSLEITRLVFL